MTEMPLINSFKYFFRYCLSRSKWKPVTVIDGQASFAQAGQDLFVIEMHAEKQNGCYVEIGAQDPIRFNNTFRLEKGLGWKGLSIELRDDYAFFFNKVRKNRCFQCDATKVEYADLFNQAGFPSDIDYLQIDIDPAEASMRVLKLMPLERYRFGVITFEHDSYAEGQEIAIESRELLARAGYRPVALDVCYEGLSFEDWWIHPDVVRPREIFDGRLNGLNFSDVVTELRRERCN